MAAVASQVGAIEIVLPTVPHLVEEVTQATRNWPARPRIVVDAGEKWAAFRCARVALAAPGKIRRLVLTATSAGVPVHAYGAIDWRSDYQREFPTAANWITEVNEDLSLTLPLIAAPCLLIWGDADAISPPAVGRRLCELLPDARLHIVRYNLLGSRGRALDVGSYGVEGIER